MLTGALEGFLRSVEASDVTEFFLTLLVVGLLTALLLEKSGKAPRFRAYAPTLLTSLGILGTFIGIVVGLLDFDPQHLDQSIGALLEGLKTAFVTSVAGMGASIVLRVLAATPLLRPIGTDEDQETGPEDVLAAIREQTELLQATRDAIAGGEESSLAGQLKLLRTDVGDQTRALEATNRAIAGDEEGSLTGQIKLLRSDFEAHQRQSRDAMEAFAEKLWKQLGEFAEMLSKSATEQVIEALRQVILDFNHNLTEQFGENFKALDASVKKLVDWQEHYREQLRELHHLYQESARGIQEIESSVTKVVEASAVIPNTMDTLRNIVEVANHQIRELESHLAAFRDMRDRAVEAVPHVQQHVQTMTQDIADSVKTASQAYTALLSESDNYIEAQNQLANEMLKTLTSAGEQIQSDTQAVQSRVAESLEAMRNQLEVATKEAVDGLLEQTKRAVARSQEGVDEQIASIDKIAQHLRTRIETTVEEITAAQNRALNQAVDTLTDQMRQAVSRTGEGVNSQLQAIDKAMEAEVNRVMNQMGQALAQIAGQFTQDYTQLTGAMQQIVRRAENG